MKRLHFLLCLMVISFALQARTGSVHDDFVVWLVPSAYLFLVWLGYKVKALVEKHRTANTTENSFPQNTHF